MASLYSNENFPLPVVEALRESGHDVLTSAQAGNANQGIPDDEVLRFATTPGRAVLTLNRQDFISLHRQSSDHGGIVACTFNANFSDQARRIHHALQNITTLNGQLVRVNKGA